MPHEPQRFKIVVVQRQRKGITSGSTPPHTAIRDGTQTRADDPSRQQPERRTRVRDEEVICLHT